LIAIEVVVKGEGEGICAISLLVAVYVVYNVLTIGVACSSKEKSIMSTSDNCNVGASKSSGDGVCEVKDIMLNNMSIDDTDNDVSICANCGKEGDNLKSCKACELVKYCNRECQIAHRPQHKKACRKRAAELHDEKLFKQPPPDEDCPICFMRMPTIQTGCRYQSCCGKRICNGCVYAPVYDNQGNVVVEDKCPFCRTPMATTNEEVIKRMMKRMEANDPIVIFKQGIDYRDGTDGYPQDYNKALELFYRAGDLGNYEAYVCIGCAHEYGEGVEIDKKKARHYYELAAMKGDADARANLGIDEAQAGNMDKSVKHFMIAAACGHDGALENIQELYSYGRATKDDYTKALQSYQEYLGEIKSSQRDKAAAAREDYRYY